MSHDLNDVYNEAVRPRRSLGLLALMLATPGVGYTQATSVPLLADTANAPPLKYPPNACTAKRAAIRARKAAARIGGRS